MSILTDFFIADTAEVQGGDAEHLRAAFPIVYSARADPVKLARLENILTEAGDVLDPDALDATLVKSFGDQGPWVCEVRPSLVAALAGLSVHDVPRVAADWAGSPEWQLDGTNAKLLLSFLEELAKLAARGTAEAKPMFVLVSL